MDGGSEVCFSTLTPAPTGAALLLLSKYCGSACDLMGGGRNSLKSIPLLSESGHFPLGNQGRRGGSSMGNGEKWREFCLENLVQVWILLKLCKALRL